MTLKCVLPLSRVLLEIGVSSLGIPIPIIRITVHGVHIVAPFGPLFVESIVSQNFGLRDF